MNKKTVEIYMQKLRQGNRADLYTDGINEVWIPHSQIEEETHIKDNDYQLAITEWIAREKDII